MSGVNQARNVRMRQVSQDLALLQEALPRCIRIEGCTQQFHCNSLPNLPIHPFRKVDQPHSAAPDQPAQLERTTVVAVRNRLLKHHSNGATNDVSDLGPGVEGKQRLQFAA